MYRSLRRGPACRSPGFMTFPRAVRVVIDDGSVTTRPPFWQYKQRRLARPHGSQSFRPDPRPLCATIRGVKTLAVASTAERLAALEQQFIQIAKITKELRTHLDEVAETVRIAAEELGQHRLATSRSLALRSVPKRTATRPSGNSRTQKKRN
jgi:hypothetical protein